MLPNGLIIFLLYLITIFMLLLVLTIHEIGHFVFAKIYKVNIKEFSIGFGPKILYRTTKSGMRISLRLIPIMAYVMLDSKILRSVYKDNRKSKNYRLMMARKPKGLLYLEQSSLWRYIQIMLGGVILNLIAFLLVYIPVVCINPSFAALPFESIGDSFKAVGCNMVGVGNGDIFGQLPALPDQANSQHWTSMDWFSVFLSTFMLVNLLTFFFNILPLPPLDGWKIAKQLVETTTHKKINENVEYYLTIFICVILLWIFVSGIVMDFVH